MVEYIFCKKCGRVVDEFEDSCHWCGTKKEKKTEPESKNKNVSKK
jgi:RNA polymerase subunit RPABC4/transcription elongation factor Spt4